MGTFAHQISRKLVFKLERKKKERLVRKLYYFFEYFGGNFFCVFFKNECYKLK